MIIFPQHVYVTGLRRMSMPVLCAAFVHRDVTMSDWRAGSRRWSCVSLGASHGRLVCQCCAVHLQCVCYFVCSLCCDWMLSCLLNSCDKCDEHDACQETNLFAIFVQCIPPTTSLRCAPSSLRFTVCCCRFCSRPLSVVSFPNSSFLLPPSLHLPFHSRRPLAVSRVAVGRRHDCLPVCLPACAFRRDSEVHCRRLQARQF
jgi:hypothetical protein